MPEKKYKIVKEIDGLEVGSVVLESIFNSTEAEDYLAEGRIEVYEDEVPPAPLEKEEDKKGSQGVTNQNEPEVPVAPEVKLFEGKEIISDVSREVNGKKYHHVRLGDGSAQDLTDEEYELKVVKENHG